MFMRLVQVKVKPESSELIGDLYSQRILPTLHHTQGCLYASLIRSTSVPHEAISLTLWESSGDADAYEQSGAFQQLITEAQPYLSDSSEWKVQLSKYLTLEYAPVAEEPVIRSYSLATPSGTHARIGLRAPKYS